MADETTALRRNSICQGEEAVNTRAGTVFIVDHDREVGMALMRLVAAAGYRAQAFESAARFLAAQDKDTPGCLLLDASLPGSIGIELQRALDGTPGARPIIVLSGRDDIQASVEAMKAGAVDFLTKPIDGARLFPAIEQALLRDAEQRRKRQISDALAKRLKRLTPREREVMAHVIRGRLNKQIAADLCTVVGTVKIHRGRVMSKLRVRSVAELVRLAVHGGMAIDPILHPTTAAPNGQACA
jgi:FixJ family two-component response regulator